MKRLSPATLPSALWERPSTTYQSGERVDVARSAMRSTRGAVPVVWCHGFALSNPAVIATAGPYRERLSAIAALGHPVLSADLGGGSTWSSDTAIARASTLVTWAGTVYGTRVDKVVIAGESMGSLLAMNWAWRDPQRVAALWVRAPLTALDAFHDRPNGFAGAIESAYGGLAAYNAALPTHDPLLNRAALSMLGSRTRIDFTTDDELLPASEVMGHATAVGAAEVHAWAGGHADNQWTDTWAVAEWVHRTVREYAP
ncbi:MAG TPA: alpha/beta fold hydrolase [Propionibacteriaceae bacterium]|nr:alpha/beta fold hydrolase [Propionibacteriaceae bacterium]